jgi:hypothetical protein
VPEAILTDPKHRPGKYRERVFVGGSYESAARSRLDEIKQAIGDSGFTPVIADEIKLEREEDIHHETMVLLHSCRLAVFEMSQPSGALMEIERLPDYGIYALVLFADPDSKGYRASRMLSTFVMQHDSTIALKPYLTPNMAKAYVTTWLGEMRGKGFG